MIWKSEAYLFLFGVLQFLPLGLCQQNRAHSETPNFPDEYSPNNSRFPFFGRSIDSGPLPRLPEEVSSVSSIRNETQESLFTTLLNSVLYASPSIVKLDETTVTMAIKEGYEAEEHLVRTEDGYLLTIHRILPKRKFKSKVEEALATNSLKRDLKVYPAVSVSSYIPAPYPTRRWYTRSKRSPRLRSFVDTKKHRGVIFLQHGLMGSSDNWITNVKNKSIAYQLSDLGYDIWMGNFRGNMYSMKHVNMGHKNPEFWRFSYDQMAAYDLPAMINYVLWKTGEKQLDYIGHSMGTAVFFAAMSESKDLQSKVSSMIALAPVSTINSVKSPIGLLAPVARRLQTFLKLMGYSQDLITNPLLLSLWQPYRQCGRHAICQNLQFLITGFDPERASEEMLPVIMTHNPAGASTQTLLHFAQEVESGLFRRFDYGHEQNLVRYGSSTPPEYDVTNIDVPITLIYAPNDIILAEENVINLKNLLPDVQHVLRVADPKFSHLDFLWAKNSDEMINQNIIKILTGDVGNLTGVTEFPEIPERNDELSLQSLMERPGREGKGIGSGLLVTEPVSSVLNDIRYFFRSLFN